MSRRAIIPLSLVLVRLHEECCVLFWDSHYKRDTSKLKGVQQGASGLALMMYRDRRRELGGLSLRKRFMVETHLLSYTNEREVMDRSRLFSGAQ